MRLEHSNSIIPSVNVRSEEEALERLRLGLALVGAKGLLHLDIGDGRFTPRRTWGTPAEFRRLRDERPELFDALVEVHLMASDAEGAAAEWLAAGAARVILQRETFFNEDALHGALQRLEGRAMLSLGPHAKQASLEPFFDECDAFQILAVSPGESGERLDGNALERIKFVRLRAPDATIEADGGMTPETVEAAREAGADICVSASYLFESADPAGAYRKLTEAATMKPI